MKSYRISSVFFSILLIAAVKLTKLNILSKQSKLKNTPILVMTGFMNKCTKEDKDWYIREIKNIMKSSWSTPPVHCVPYNSGPFGDMKLIAKETCNFVLNKM